MTAWYVFWKYNSLFYAFNKPVILTSFSSSKEEIDKKMGEADDDNGSEREEFRFPRGPKSHVTTRSKYELLVKQQNTLCSAGIISTPAPP